MKKPRLLPIGYIIEIAVEAFVGSVFATIGEKMVSEGVKAYKKRRKRLKKEQTNDEEPSSQPPEP